MLGNRIKTLRKEREITQGSLAQAIGITQGFLSDIERDKKTPGGDILLSLSRFFDVDPHWLLTGEGKKRASEKIIDTLDQKLARAVIAERQDRSGSTEPMTLTTTEAEIIELLRDLPEDARFDEYDNIRALWLSLCRGKNPPV